MNDRENRIRAWRRQGPAWVPISAGIPYLEWDSFGYDENELEEICMHHPILFPNYQKGNLARFRTQAMANRPEIRAGAEYVDGWGCGWVTHWNGMVGTVKRHYLDDWEKLDSLPVPDIEKSDGVCPIDWEALRRTAEHPDRENFFFGVGLPHGHTFLRAQDLRGYENLIYDMADEDPRLDKMLHIITDFYEQLVRRYVALRPDSISIQEDLGMQKCPMLSPAHFRRYILPCYERLIRPVKEAGIILHEHSDGYILDLADDLIGMGGEVINVQDLVNGIDNLAKVMKGRISLDLDIDRQNITVHGSRKDIFDHVRECVTKLGGKEGGLSLTYSPWPPTPPQNMDAVFEAMEIYGVTGYPFR